MASDAMETGAAEFKRESLYAPSPHRDSKRPKSEERESTRQSDLGTDRMDAKATSIGDVLQYLRELSHDFIQQQSQTRWLIMQTADRQRQEAASKLSIKTGGNTSYVAAVEHYATEAGISQTKQNTLVYSNRIGRNLSPFCIVDVGDARTKSLMLDHMKKTYHAKVAE